MEMIFRALRRWYREVANASPLFALLRLSRVLAVFYQLWFTLRIPISRYLSWNQSLRLRYIALFVLCFLFDKSFPYLPNKATAVARAAETTRLRTLSVAIKKLAGEINAVGMSRELVFDVSHRLLDAARAEVESVLNVSGGIDATLMVEDSARPQNLAVLARANTDRDNPSYPKKSLIAWKAMQEKATQYNGNFRDPAKVYRSILAIPLESKLAGKTTAIGVLSIDSSRPHDFDGISQEVETKLLPYLSLLVLVLTKRGSIGDGTGQGTPARVRRSTGRNRPTS